MKIDIGVIVLILTAVLVLSIHLSTNSLEFNRDNPGWNGTSTFFDILDRHTAIDITDSVSLSGKNNSTLLILAPDKPYLPQDLTAYREYVTRGNTLFLADDFGSGNGLLRGIGSTISIQPGTLASIDKAYNDSYTVVTPSIIESPLTQNVSSILLDRAATVEGGEPLIRSSIMSWIDTDGDRRITDEELGTYTVLAREQLGNGQIFVFSDPSIFINGMGTLEETWDNRIFIRDIITASPVLLVDQVHSRTCTVEGGSGIVRILKHNQMVKIGLVSFLLLILIILIRKRSSRVYKKGTS